MKHFRSVPRIEVIATTYNRKDITVRGFYSLLNQKGISQDFILHSTVLDDGSTDGTAEYLSDTFPDFVTCIPGPGNFFWSKGMAYAESGVTLENLDFILWFNDDVVLDSDAISRLLAVACEFENSIIIGSMRDSNGRTSYSGLKKRNRRPGNLSMIEPTAKAINVDTFHGNLVLIPAVVASKLGGIDPSFQHAYGDIDYGLRAQKLGINCLVAPHSFGICERNTLDLAWRNPEVKKSDRLRIFLGRKGYPLRSHIRYNRRHGGIWWPLFVSSSYFKNLAIILFRPNRSKT
jgi:GT2 family glycosyltransferase